MIKKTIRLWWNGMGFLFLCFLKGKLLVPFGLLSTVKYISAQVFH